MCAVGKLDYLFNIIFYTLLFDYSCIIALLFEKVFWTFTLTFIAHLLR